MRPTTLIVLFVAIVFGSIAALGARALIAGRSVPMIVEVERTTIVVAAQPLVFGTVLEESNMEEVEWPSSVVPQGSFRSRAQLISEGKRVVLSAIQKNEPIVQSRVTAPGQRASLSALIEDGMRAVTIRVDDVRGVAGFLMPGDHVDVVMTRNENAASFADVLLQNVKVLAVDQAANERKEQAAVAKAVTVEVNAQQAQKLILASGYGALSLILRQTGNADSAAVSRVTIADLGQPEVVKTDRFAEMDARLADLKKFAENAESNARDAAKRSIVELEARLKASQPAPAAPLPPVVVQPPRQPDTYKVRVTRGTKTEELSVGRELREISVAKEGY